MLQLLLGIPEAGINALFLQQLFMAALFRDPPLLQHINIVRLCHIRQAVGDENHGF